MNNNPRWVFLGTRMQPGQPGNLAAALDVDSLKRLMDRVNAYPPGARLMLTLELEPKERTLDQNAYYHGYIVRPLAERLGWTHDEVHRDLKKRFLGGGSTTKLSPSQTNEFHEEVRAWAMIVHEFYLAAPNEVAETRAMPAAVNE